jgi:Type III restriction enzyme, res subunit
MKLTTQQKKQLHDFDSLTTKLKGLVSFHRIKTIDELLSRYNYIGEVEGFARTEPLKGPQAFELIAKILRSKLEDSFVTTAKQEDIAKLLEANQWTPTWIDSDSLIETDMPPPEHGSVMSMYDSIIPPKNPLQTCELRYFQLNSAKECYWKLVKENKKAFLQTAKTGDGKTFFAGQIIRWLLDSGFLEGKTFSPWQILYVTKASIVEQSKEDLANHFGINMITECCVTNYDQLRAALGSNMVEQLIVVKDGEHKKVWKWKPFLHPLLFIWDECHGLKNEGSTQSEIAQAVNDIKGSLPVYQIFMSATPFSKVSQAKCFAVATKKKFRIGFGDQEISNDNWPMIAKKIAEPMDPADFDKGAIKRLLREFNDYIGTFKNVRRKFRGILSTEIIDFATKEEHDAYKAAWDRYMEEKAKIEGGTDKIANSRFLILVQFLKFRQAAEIIRSAYVAKRMFADWQAGFAPVYAANFKPSIAKTILFLHNDYNIPREKISVIWGGDKAFGGAEEKYSREEIHNVLAACMRGEEVSMKILKEIQNQLSIEAAGLSEVPAELDLGQQNPTKRWKEIKRFQSGKSEFCFFSFKAGGAGLSLHQNKPTLRPRKQYNSPTYNEMEAIQAEGRTAREGSLSNTDITTLLYRGTIEVPVTQRVLAKRLCSNVVSSHGNSDSVGQGDKIISGSELSAQMEREMHKILSLLGPTDEEDIEEQAAQTMFDEIEDENNNDKGE